jgi:two-component system chemotaxis response regulator CheB
VRQLGNISEFTCPNCHVSLIKINNGTLQRFRCHTGHSFSSASLVAELTDSEQSLWNTIRAIEERLRLLKHLAQHASELKQTETIGSLTRELAENEQRAGLLRQAAMPDGSKNLSNEFLNSSAPWLLGKRF